MRYGTSKPLVVTDGWQYVFPAIPICYSQPKSLREYNPKDDHHFLGSEDLIEFAIAHQLYDPTQGAFDFHKAYIRDEKLDTTYNYPRVWALQAFFSPEIENDVTKMNFLYS